MTEWLPKLKDASGPVYIAIVDALAADIRTGRIAPGMQLMPQRDLANRLNLSVGTVTKAYAEAERRGLIVGKSDAALSCARVMKVRTMACRAPSI